MPAASTTTSTESAAFLESRERSKSRSQLPIVAEGTSDRVLGDGMIEGVAPLRGRTPPPMPSRDSAQSVTTVDFRVHEVARTTDLDILRSHRISVDIATAAAPHQAESQRIYFYRETGHRKRPPVLN